MALAAINYTVIHSPYVFLLAFVLFIHELGHYLVAKMHKASVKYPFFIPIPFVGIAFTRIKDIPLDKKPIISLAGMLFSISFIINLIILVLMALNIETQNTKQHKIDLKSN